MHLRRRVVQFLWTHLLAALMLGAVNASANAAFAMHPIREADFQTKVEGGNPVDKKEWPATFEFCSSVRCVCQTNGCTGPADKEVMLCTATAIGPRVIITAAHCFGKGENDLNGTLQSNSDDSAQLVELVCDKDKDFVYDQKDPRTVFDVALCLAPPDGIKLPGGAPFEIIATPQTPLPNREVWLLGFGCTTFGSEIVGALYSGRAFPAPNPYQKGYLALSSGATICAGDSGGAAYVKSALHPQRIIIALNSRRTPPDQAPLSLLAPLYDRKIGEYISTWAKKNHVSICGLSDLPPGVCHP